MSKHSELVRLTLADEAAVRLQANDSLNNFTAGDDPGPGNRDIAGDGYKLNIALSTVR